MTPYFELKPTTTAYPQDKRIKRFNADLISLGIQGFTAFNINRKQNQLKKGMKIYLKNSTNWKTK